MEVALRLRSCSILLVSMKWPYKYLKDREQNWELNRRTKARAENARPGLFLLMIMHHPVESKCPTQLHMAGPKKVREKGQSHTKGAMVSKTVCLPFSSSKIWLPATTI